MEDEKALPIKSAMSTRFTADPAFAAKTKAFLEDIKKKPEPSLEPTSKMSNKGGKRASLKKEEFLAPKSPPPVSVKQLSNDMFCWHCHKYDAPIPCKTCLRSFHSDCLQASGNPPELDECFECKMSKEPWVGVGHFSMYVAYIIKNMLTAESIQFFIHSKPEDFEYYEDYIINKVDIHQITKNNEMRKYRNSKALIADVKWILHNAIVYFGANHALSLAAKNLLKVCQNNIQDLERCQQCFQRANAGIKDWFTRICDKPHPVVLAKVRGFPFWPSKVLHFDASNAECWFFGQHDKASVPIHNLHLLTKDVQIPGKKRHGLQKAVDEMEVYLENFKKQVGPIEYFPPQTVPSFEQLSNLFSKMDTTAGTPTSPPKNIPGQQPYDAEANEQPSSPPDQLADPQSPQYHNMEEALFSFPSQESGSSKGTAKRDLKVRRGTESESLSPAKKKVKLMPLSKQKEDAIKRAECCHVKVEKLNGKMTHPVSSEKTLPIKIKQERVSPSKSPDESRGSGQTAEIDPISPTSNNIPPHSPINKTKSPPPLTPNKTKSPVSTTLIVKSPTQCFISASSISTTSPQSQNTPIKMTIRTSLPPLSTPQLATNKPQIITSKTPSITPIIFTNRMDKTPLAASTKQNTTTPTIRVIETFRKPSTEMPKLYCASSPVFTSISTPSSFVQNEEYIVAEKVPPSLIDNSLEPKSNGTTVNLLGEKGTALDLQEMLFTSRASQEDSEQSSNKLLLKLRNQAKSEEAKDEQENDVQFEKEIIDLTEQEIPESFDLKEEVKRLRGLLKDCKARLLQQKQEYDKRIRDLRYNNQLNLLEMKTCCEMEKMRETAKIKIEFEELLQKKIEENKKKQWCASCGKEAFFFCCWNTSYCNYSCQSKHWNIHSGSCTQVTKQITTTTLPLETTTLPTPQQMVALPRVLPQVSKVISTAITSRPASGQPQVLFLLPQHTSQS